MRLVTGVFSIPRSNPTGPDGCRFRVFTTSILNSSAIPRESRQWSCMADRVRVLNLSSVGTSIRNTTISSFSIRRGCGKSTPHASLKDNTTWHLVSDMEALRKHLGIGDWLVFGGSWGSTLALAYSQAHPRSVTELILRGVFTLRRMELMWFYQNGASYIFPDEWEKFLEPIPESERDDLIAAYYDRLTDERENVRMQAARAWSIWEGATLSLLPDRDRVGRFGTDRFAEAFARIECHYFMNGGFFETDGQLLERAHSISRIPTVIVHGRYDVCTPLRNAWDLHLALPEADFRVVPDAGHAATEPGIVHELVTATDRFRVPGVNRIRSRHSAH